MGDPGIVYNITLVRHLCAEAAAEQDPVRVAQLIDLLRAVIKEDQEEMRIRMAFLRKSYTDVIEETKTAD